MEAEVVRKSKRSDPSELEEKEIPRMDTSGRSRDLTTVQSGEVGKLAQKKETFN